MTLTLKIFKYFVHLGAEMVLTALALFILPVIVTELHLPSAGEKRLLQDTVYLYRQMK